MVTPVEEAIDAIRDIDGLATLTIAEVHAQVGMFGHKLKDVETAFMHLVNGVALPAKPTPPKKFYPTKTRPQPPEPQPVGEHPMKFAKNGRFLIPYTKMAVGDWVIVPLYRPGTGAYCPSTRVWMSHPTRRFRMEDAPGRPDAYKLTRIA